MPFDPEMFSGFPAKWAEKPPTWVSTWGMDDSSTAAPPVFECPI
jgi:hypothetical protein